MTPARFALAVVLLAACAAGADEPKTDPPKAKGPARLTFKALGEMLTDLGYEPTATDNNTFHKITATSKEFTHTVWLYVTPDQKSVGFYNSGALPDGFEKAPAEAWRKLLEKNDDLTGAAFMVEEGARRVVFRQTVPNADITPAQLRKAITGYVDTLQQTKALWNRVNFLPEMTAAAKTELAALAGTWKPTEWVVSGVKQPAADVEKVALVFAKDELVVTIKEQKMEVRLHLPVADGAVVLDAYDISGALSMQARFERAGDTMTLCLNANAALRPADLTSTAENKNIRFVLKRQPK